MAEVNVKTNAVAERQVEWVPKSYAWSTREIAIIRDGKINRFPQVAAYLVQADIDGYIEFIQAIKRAMAETTK